MAEQKKAFDANEWKQLVGKYNVLVGGFRQTWSILRAMVLMSPDQSAELNMAKRRISDLQKRIAFVEQNLKRRVINGVGAEINALDLELRIFKELLDKIDAEISPGHIKVFSEKKHDTRDAEIINLLGYYLRRNPLTDDDLDKIDLLATELCCTRVGQKRVLKSVFEVDKVLDSIFQNKVPARDYEEPIINEFRQAVNKIQNCEEIEEITGSDVIATMREFKKEIKETLPNPRVLKAMAVYNITLNNKLADIFEKETGDIKSTTQLMSSVKEELDQSPGDKREAIKAVLEKVAEIQRSFLKRSEESGYDLGLIIDASRQRKAIADAMSKIEEIKLSDDEREEEDEGFRIKPTQVLINEVTRGLLGMETHKTDMNIIKDINLDLNTLDPLERSVFLIDLDAMRDERRMYEVIQEAIVLSHKIVADYRNAKEFLSREEVEEVVSESLELAGNLREEIQNIMDNYDTRGTSKIKLIDLMKIKSGLSRNIKRLTNYARSEGFLRRT